MAPDVGDDPLAARLERLEGLLETLTEALDLREVFDRVWHDTQQVLPHDIMGVVVFSEDGQHMRLHVAAGLPVGVAPVLESPVPDPALLQQPWEALIIDDVQKNPFTRLGPAARIGMKSAVSAPVRFGGRVQASVTFFSSDSGTFTRDDVTVARRIASHIGLAMSHHRLAEEAGRRRALEARASSLALLDQSLATLTDSGQLSELFDRISAATAPVLPHDALALSVLLPDGRRARRYASSGLDVTRVPESVEVPGERLRDPAWEVDLVDDLLQRQEPYNAVAASLGFRSAMRLAVRLEPHFVGALAFLSRSPANFVAEEVPIGRRVANRIAVSLERELGVDAMKRADEANERAARLEARVRTLTEELDARSGYRRVVGESGAWRQVLTQAAQVAATEATVLLQGESGTGKEVVARFVHRGSARHNGPFVAVNCAALPEHLLEAELFGFERGAFTGATQSKPGMIEQAAGGVLFLDEVGEMTLAAQAKFLRVLQEREFQRLGGTRQLRADIRVVAATNRDLPKAIERGTFREDLYYRLNVFQIRLPPLRERRDDVLPLSDAFIREIGRSLGRPPSGISRDARQALLDYQWPGNVRELHNMLERAAILADGGLIVREHFAMSPRPATTVSGASAEPARSPALEPVTERAALEQALQDARYNKAKAAKALGLSRAQLYVRLKRHGLD